MIILQWKKGWVGICKECYGKNRGQESPLDGGEVESKSFQEELAFNEISEGWMKVD